MVTGERQMLLSGDLTLPESPRWHDGRLWFCDILTGRIFNTGVNGDLDLFTQYGGWVSGFGRRPNGDLAVVDMDERRLLRFDGQQLIDYCDLTAGTSLHANDMIVGNNGYAYIGEVGFDFHGGEPFQTANLVMVDLSVDEPVAKVVAAGLACPNGMVITPDQSRLIVAESLGECLTVFDIDPDGTLVNRRTWATMEGMGPDGICMDAEGGIWAACPFAAQYVRVTEGGEITEMIESDRLPTACCLGGPDGRTLFLCSSLRPDEAVDQGCGGRIEMIEVAVPAPRIF